MYKREILFNVTFHSGGVNMHEGKGKDNVNSMVFSKGQANFVNRNPEVYRNIYS